MLDFEVLDGAISNRRFDEEDVLGMIRHLIQHRLRFKVMLAGLKTAPLLSILAPQLNQ